MKPRQDLEKIKPVRWSACKDKKIKPVRPRAFKEAYRAVERRVYGCSKDKNWLLSICQSMRTKQRETVSAAFHGRGKNCG